MTKKLTTSPSRHQNILRDIYDILMRVRRLLKIQAICMQTVISVLLNIQWKIHIDRAPMIPP